VTIPQFHPAVYNTYITSNLIITKYINKTYQHKNKCLLLTARLQKGR
jgi:hypothetical protein